MTAVLPDNFGVLILTHGRPEGVAKTINTLKRTGYTGRWWLVCDSGDKTIDQYRERWGNDRVVVFDKAAVDVDLADNGGSNSVVVFARQAAPRIAADLGLRYFLELDDDYGSFQHRFLEGDKLKVVETRDLDTIMASFLSFLIDTGATTVAFAQGGDFIGGGDSFLRRGLTRKAMNAFFIAVDNPPRFCGRLNEDVNMYLSEGKTGGLVFTYTRFMLTQGTTQKNAGGLTEAYLEDGTYRKSFYSVVLAPSCVTVKLMGDKHLRVHHSIAWNLAVPKIVSERFRKS